MKKLFIALTTLVLGITLIACGEKFHVDVFIFDTTDAYMAAMIGEIENGLKKEKIKFTIHNAEGSQATQNGQIDTVISKGTNLIVINMVEPKSLSTVYDKAKQAGIPLVSVNRQPDPDERGFLKGADKKDFAMLDGLKGESGPMVAKMVYEYIKKDYTKYLKTDQKTLNYLYVHGARKMPAAVEMGVDTKSALAKEFSADGITVQFTPGVTQDIDSEWTAALAKQGIATLYSKDSQLLEKTDVIIACNDNSASGIITFLNEKEYNTGEAGAKFIPVFGLDALATARALIKAGKQAGSVLQNYPENARLIVAAAVNVRNKKDYLLDATADKVELDSTSDYLKAVIHFEIYDKVKHGE